MQYISNYSLKECPSFLLFLFLLFFSFLFFLFPSLSLAVGTVGVKPLRLDLELSPSKKGEFEIEVYSTSTEDTPIHLSLFDAMQKENGMLGFVDIGQNPFSCSEWIKLEKEEVTVPGGQNVMVKGEVLVPPGKAGSRIGVIMVEPGYEKKKGGVSVRLRYAVVLRLKIMGRPVMEQIKLEKFGMRKLSPGSSDGTSSAEAIPKSIDTKAIDTPPVIEALISNQAEIDVQVKGNVLIQDSSGRIMTQLTLTTDALDRKKEEREKEEREKNKEKDKHDKDKFTRPAEEEEDRQRVYSGAKVAFFAKIDKPLSPGEYTAILNLKYGKRTISAKEKIKLSAKDLASLGKKSGEETSFEIKPANLEIKAQAGGVRSAFFNIVNLTDQPLKTAISVKDIEYDPEGRAVIRESGTTPYSASAWLSLDKSEAEIGPKLSVSVSMKLEVPDSAPVGGRYSQVVVEKIGDESGYTENNFLGVAVVLPGKVEPLAEIKSLKRLDKNEGLAEAVVDIKNNALSQLIPKGRMVIKDAYNNEVEEVELKLKARAILPQSEGRMSGELRKKLVPGEYMAIAEIDYGGKERATSKINFTVK